MSLLDFIKDKVLQFRVRGWLEDEDFKRLLSIAHYIGREGRESIFKLNIDAILSKNLTVDEVIDILEDVNAIYDDKLVEYLEERLSLGREAYIEHRNGLLIMKFNIYLGELLNQLKGLIKYERNSKVFIAKPYKYWELISKLHSLGFKIIDKTEFKREIPLNYELKFKGELRDYQKEALDSWLRNGSKGVIALPTGSGKTVIAIAALTLLSQHTLIIAYTKEQLIQWKNAILKFTNLPEYMIGMYYSGEKRLSPITLTTYQTAYRHIDKFSKNYSLLIIDEVHHLPAEKFKFIAESLPILSRMGLSATPYREDGKHVELFPLMGGIVYYKSPQELAKQGYLASYRIVTVKVELKPNEKRRLYELRSRYRKLVGYTKFEEILRLARLGDERAIEALRIHNEMNQLIHKSLSKIEKVEEIIRRELMNGSKIIVFAHYVDLAEEIARRVNGYLLTGEMSSDRRKIILERFRNSKSGVLVVTTLGDEGLDIPDANVGIFVAGTGSRRQFLQRLGRLLRPANNKVATLYEIITKGTIEELQARKRKELNLDELMSNESKI